MRNVCSMCRHISCNNHFFFHNYSKLYLEKIIIDANLYHYQIQRQKTLNRCSTISKKNSDILCATRSCEKMVGRF